MAFSTAIKGFSQIDFPECLTIHNSKEIEEKSFSINTFSFASNCYNPSIANTNYTLYNYSFIPNQSTSIKRIKVNLQIIHDLNGQNNFDPANPVHMNYLHSLFDENSTESVNGMYQNIMEPLYQGATGDPYIKDSRIRFSLESINFHMDSGGLQSINGKKDTELFADYCESNFGIKIDTEINIYLIPSGYHPTLNNTSVGGFAFEGKVEF